MSSPSSLTDRATTTKRRGAAASVALLALTLLAAACGGDTIDGADESPGRNAEVNGELDRSEGTEEAFTEPTPQQVEPTIAPSEDAAREQDEEDTSDAAEATAEPTSTPAPTATAVPAPPRPTVTPEPAPAGIEAWLGTYEWVEFAEGDPGSNQTIVHELILSDQAADGSLTGTFTEMGFQTNVSLTVDAVPGENGITIFASSDGPPFYATDQRLFALSGDPAAPTTSLGAVQPFLADTAPQSGTYFS